MTTSTISNRNPAETDILGFERSGDIAVIVYHDEERNNPLNRRVQQELRALLAKVRADSSIRALVLTAAGRFFCVGADLGSLITTDSADVRSVGERTAHEMREGYNPLITDLRDLPVPTICAVNGACAGAGVGLALACDVVIAARSSYFYLPFIPRLGIVPDLGTTWFLEHMLGRARAQALTLLGERLQAEQAAQWGLIWACVEDATLRDQALSLAQRLAQLPAHGAVETRRIFEAAAGNDLQAQLALEAERQRELLDRPAFGEGVRAFMEKREPRFPSREPGNERIIEDAHDSFRMAMFAS
jgi:2-(1,2-epoxy-1,2-dihydrophenyl)acetyl-CoA isomerase